MFYVKAKEYEHDTHCDWLSTAADLTCLLTPFLSIPTWLWPPYHDHDRHHHNIHEKLQLYKKTSKCFLILVQIFILLFKHTF